MMGAAGFCGVNVVIEPHAGAAAEVNKTIKLVMNVGAGNATESMVSMSLLINSFFSPAYSRSRESTSKHFISFTNTRMRLDNKQSRERRVPSNALRHCSGQKEMGFSCWSRRRALLTCALRAFNWFPESRLGLKMAKASYSKMSIRAQATEKYQYVNLSSSHHFARGFDSAPPSV